jgi:hypothetical protein
MKIQKKELIMAAILAALAVFFLYLAFFCPKFAFAQTVYVGKTTTTVGWDEVNNPAPVSYEITLIRDVTGERFLFRVNTRQILISPNALDASGKRLKSGVYEIRVHGLMASGAATPDCSSLDSGCAKLQNLSPGTWKVNYKPAPIGGKPTAK